MTSEGDIVSSVEQNVSSEPNNVPGGLDQPRAVADHRLPPGSKPQNVQTSSTAQTMPTSSWTYTDYTKRTWRFREQLAAWYMGRVAGRYCPCQWGRFRVKRLIRLCGRIDDAYCNAQFRDFCDFHLWRHQRGR